MRQLVFTFILIVISADAFSQDSLSLKKHHGYDYFRSRFKIGYTIGRYTYHHSGPEIYMYRANNGLAAAGADNTMRILGVDDKFTPMQTFRGICIGAEIGEENLRLELYFTTRKSTSDIKYTFDNGIGTPVVDYHEKVRMRFNAMSLGLGYKFTKLPQLTMGVCADLGILRTQKKVASESGDWEPWFYSFPLKDGNPPKPTTPVITYGLYVCVDLGPLSFKLNQNFTLLDGDLNSETYKYTNIPFSSKNFPMANTSLTASVKF